MFRQLANKIVLITGASTGIGEACAKIFHSNGNHVIITARRLDKLNALKEELLKVNKNSKVLALELDVSCEDSLQRFVKDLPDDMKDIDILINNAGCAIGVDPVANILAKDLNQVLDTNVKGVFNVTREFLPSMIKLNRGHIFNISSIAGSMWYPNGSIYCASKAAINAFSDVLRKEVVATKIRVTNVCPGLVETDFSVVRFGGDVEKAKVPYKGIEPLTAEDIADNIFYCASRPEHVQITEITIMANNQASPSVIHRN
ncbi:short-chain dehydrogenase/reductase (SDR) family protein [Tieghemostelium lacteum]|uniref:Short-chain dehydrogenase/reductase (SDR) family protein n=1 Tax=Tieghemostelium lacteum TaxID=361077 RepID=A0A151ZRT0_TIELA|nr:short-chain dehydrogenase/reductase (SDR) family protein [Tieghemostelium lacteum]|eukprot:KYQ96731.1 short-chain dehydrogenase/reductase (SDR) family protein [Tieghemostelium lacteum]